MKRLKVSHLEFPFRANIFLEEYFAYVPDGDSCRRIGMQEIRNLLRNACSQKTLCEQEAEKERSSTAQRGCLFHKPVPIDLPTGAGQFGYVTDPRQAFPEMHRPMDTEDEKQILRR